MTTQTIPDVALPAGARIVDESIEESWRMGDYEYRVIWTAAYTLDVGPGKNVVVYGSAVQYADGSVDDGSYPDGERPMVRVQGASDGLASDQIRELSALMTKVANEVDGWAQR